MPSLLLQKPSKTSKAKDHVRSLERRLDLWNKGELMELLFEGTTIQRNLKTVNTRKSVSSISKKFTEQMSKGNINAAIKLLSSNMENGIVPLNENTIKQLIQKHPKSKKADAEILLADIPERVHQVRFDGINAELVRKAALKTRGGSGPSGMDGDGWRHILTSNSFKECSKELCVTFANVIKKLCSNVEDSKSLEAFLACRLIPLDKNPGIRPIGVGEVLRRIAGKVVVHTVREDVISSVGSLQVCAGQEAGCEAAIHAMHSIFESEETEAVLLLDASNAFNSINRNAFLHNVKVICPSISTYVQNCYNDSSRLFVVGGKEIKSTEGTTQGDPIAMYIYAIAIIPLILMMIDIVAARPNQDAKVAAYADDVTAAGNLTGLKHLWDVVNSLGPKFGYYPEATKSWLIVKQEKLQNAKEIFKTTNIKITTEGKKHLGATIGTVSYKEEYVNSKIDEWIREIKMLAEIAKISPHAAYTCFTSGYKQKFNYVLRTIPNISHLLQRVDDVINTCLIPALTGGEFCTEVERQLISLPPRLGGLGIPILSTIADDEYKNSKMLTTNIHRNIVNQERRYNPDNVDIRKIKTTIKNRKTLKRKELKEKVMEELNEKQLKLLEINSEPNASIWLTTLPIKDEGYLLDKQSFWDLIRIRYGWQLKRLPENCACGGKFDLMHALSCKKGGFVTLRHNEIRDVTAKLLGEVCKDVTTEPVLQQLTGESFNEKNGNESDGARLDICARGFWVAGQKAFYDVRVFNPLAKRYANQSLRKSYEINEKEKKRSYNQRILEVDNGSFTPLIMNAMGGMGRECQIFYQRLSEKLADKRKTNISITVSWVKRKISFALMKAVVLCIRGSRTIFNNQPIMVDEDPSTSELMSRIY